MTCRIPPIFQKYLFLFFDDCILDGIPDPVPFRVEPDTNSSVYVEWSASSPNTDPLLLRYLIRIQGPFANDTTEMNFDLLSGKRSLVIQDLEPNVAYQVAVTASSLVGVAQLPNLKEVTTFSNGETCDGSCDWLFAYPVTDCTRHYYANSVEFVHV